MWQSKREISRECNDINGSAKGSQISEKYWGEVGKGKRVDVYLEVQCKEDEGEYIFWMKQVPVHKMPLAIQIYVRIHILIIDSLLPRYNWNIVESGIKHHNHNPLLGHCLSSRRKHLDIFQTFVTWSCLPLDSIKIFRSLNLNLHVLIVMVNLNIYFAYFHFVLVSLCVFNQTNQI
jgi:hypothetical protein